MIALAFVAGCRQQQTQPGLTSVKYDSWTEDIVVENGTIVHTKTEYEYDTPTSATPSGQKTTQILEGKVSAEQMAALEKTIRESGFLDLKDRYGADEGHRYYPYRIEVKIGGAPKLVEFRSNPQFEGAPEAFSKVEKAMQDLSAAVRGK